MTWRNPTIRAKISKSRNWLRDKARQWSDLGPIKSGCGNYVWKNITSYEVVKDSLTISSSPCWLQEGSGQQVNSGTRGAKTPYGVVYHTLGLQPHASIRPGLHCSWKLWATLFISLIYVINTRQCPKHCFVFVIRPLKNIWFLHVLTFCWLA